MNFPGVSVLLFRNRGGGTLKSIVALLFAVLLPAPFASLAFGAEEVKNKIEILNNGDVFEQGDTIAVKISGRTVESNIAVAVFGKTYRFNGAGLSFIGIDAIQKPGKYQLVPVDLENPNQFWLNEMFKNCGNCLTIEVVSRKYQEEWFKKFKPTEQQQKQRAREAEIMQAAYNSVDWVQNYIIGKYISPLPGKNIGELEITDPFLIWRRYSSAKNDRDWHRGVDLRVAEGTPVAAINSGIVVLAAKDFLLEGNMVILYHGLGIFSLYIHLSEIKVATGQKVNASEIIGFSGRGGAKSTGPHLHLGLKINGATVDPLKFIETANKYFS